MISAVASIPILTAPMSKSSKQASSLRAQERDRRHLHRRHAAGVLSGQRGDRGQAMHAMRGEGLEVGLDAGAAAGIGAGDGQGAERMPGVCMRAIVPEPPSASGRGVASVALVDQLQRVPRSRGARCRPAPWIGMRLHAAPARAEAAPAGRR
jgi:hypothetical protein